MATHIEPLLTVADLDLMLDDGNRYEVIDGELFVSRSPSLTHQSVSGNLFLSIKTYLVENPIGEIWVTPGVMNDERRQESAFVIHHSSFIIHHYV
jgi:hypothetical protein